jgi:hypothetical protein
MDGIIPAQVASITPTGIHLEDGLLLPAACIFLDGTVFLWDPPASVTAWGREHLRVFEAVVPRPGGYACYLFSALLFYFLFELSAPPWTWIGVVRQHRRPLPLRAARTLLPPSFPSPPLTMDRSLTGAHRNSRSRHRRGDGAPPAVGAGVPRGPGHPGRGDEYGASLSAPYLHVSALLLSTPSYNTTCSRLLVCVCS